MFQCLQRGAFLRTFCVQACIVFCPGCGSEPKLAEFGGQGGSLVRSALMSVGKGN